MESRRYYIPDNYDKKGTVMGGMLKLRNVIEAAIVCVPLAMVIWNGLNIDFRIKIWLLCIFVAPFLVVTLFGINGDSFFTFIKYGIHWYKSRKMYLYNGNPRLIVGRPADISFNTENLLGVILEKYEARKDERARRKHQTVLVEGEDFEFKEEKDLIILREMYEEDEDEDENRNDESKFQSIVPSERSYKENAETATSHFAQEDGEEVEISDASGIIFISDDEEEFEGAVTEVERDEKAEEIIAGNIRFL